MKTKKNTTRRSSQTSRSKRQARPLHKKLILHPFTIMLLLCVGVLITGATFQSHAATLDVSATVPAAPLTSPAIITSPSDQDHVTTSLITVTGTCPNQSYVKLYSNGQFTGVSQCSSGAFSIQTSLVAGANTLQVKVYNITDNEGPSSSPITVYYDVPSPASEPSTSGTPPSNTDGGQPSVNMPLLPAPQLTATTDYHYQALFPGEKWSWDIIIAGGASPYAITIEWGDGTSTTIGPDGKTAYTITHVFQTPGTYHPLITITDQSGQKTTLQMLAIVKPPTGSLFSAPIFPLGDIQSYLWVIWPTYAVITLMVASFWLGEFEITKRIAQQSLQKRLLRHRRVHK